MRTKDRLENGRPRARTYSSFDKCTYEFIRTRLEPGGHFLDLLDHLWELCCLHSLPISRPICVQNHLKRHTPSTLSLPSPLSYLWENGSRDRLRTYQQIPPAIIQFEHSPESMKASSLETSLNDGNNVLKGRLYWAQMVICIVIVHVSPWNVQLVIPQILQKNVWIVCVPWMREHITEIHYDQGSLCRG